MSKRGQITVFVILGIFLLVVGGVLYYLRLEDVPAANAERNLDAEQKVEAFRQYMDSCAQQKGKNVLIALGYYGGNKELVGPYFDAELFDSNYLVFNNEERAPSLDAIMENGEALLREELEDCLSSFKITSRDPKPIQEDIVNYGLVFDSLEVKPGAMQAEMILGKDDVSFAINWPIEVGGEDSTTEISSFAAGPYPVRLGEMSVLVENFTSQLAQNPYFIDPIYLLEYNMSYDITVVSNDTYIVLITDNQSIVNYQPLQFLFAVKVNSTGGLI